MSQSQHRQRLREMAAREAESRRPRQQEVLPPAPVVTPALVAPVERESLPPVVVQPPQPTAPVNVVATVPFPVNPPPVSQEQPVPSVQPPIVPTTPGLDYNTRGLAPDQMREHGKRTAEILSQLPQDQYEAGLQSLQAQNPNLYGIVVDELNNMSAATKEDDGVDLSSIAGGSPNPNLTAPAA